MQDPSYRNFSRDLRANVCPVRCETLRAEQRRAAALYVGVILGLPTLVVLYVLSAVGS
jgi:hypothetical protein